MIIKKVKLMHLNRLIIGLLSSFLFVACGSLNDNSKDYIKLVKTLKVVKVSSDIIKQYPGVIEEVEKVNLAFRVAGPIQKIYVNEGDFVKKGQLIAQMDARDYQVQKDAIEAQVTQVQSEYKRVEELKNRKSVSENDYEKMLAGKQMAEAKLKNANDQINDTKLYAPFSGYITKVNFDDGELVNHGTPIVAMANVSKLKVEINVPASLYINKERIKSIECTQENMPDETFFLELYSNNIKANSNGLYKLYLYHEPKSGSKLAPGMNVSVKVNCSNINSNILSIPVNSIFYKDGENYVWVVKDSMVKSRKVETANQIKNGNIKITAGLAEGEELVIGGLNLLVDGEKVKVLAPASEANVGNIL